jgi:cytochrome d ubiquinol oxidase subunit II
MERPYLFVFPITAALAAVVLAASVRYRRDDLPFPMVALIFVSAFGAAPPSSLAFMFWEGIFVFPLMLLYTFVSYTVFRGKVPSTSQIHH